MIKRERLEPYQAFSGQTCRNKVFGEVVAWPIRQSCADDDGQYTMQRFLVEGAVEQTLAHGVTLLLHFTSLQYSEGYGIFLTTHKETPERINPVCLHATS